MPAAARPHVRLSQLLRELSQDPGEGDKISLHQMVDHFGHRAFGAVLFTFAVPNALPLPPGSSGVLGLPLVLVAPQLMLGKSRLWLPGWIGKRELDRAKLDRALQRVLPVLVKIERLSSPRLTFLFGPVGGRILGLVCFLLALVVVLPIPFGNMLPAAAIAALSLALIQRDGLLALLGYLLAAVSWLVLGLSFGVLLTAARHLLMLFGLAGAWGG